MTEHISPLRLRMIEDMTVRNLSPTTQGSYIHAVKKFSLHFGRSPECLGIEDVRTYQVHLVSRGVAWATLNQVVSALRFFYGVTLARKDLPERIPLCASSQDAARDPEPGGGRLLFGGG
jgi:site-specific recombinase XerD